MPSMFQGLTNQSKGQDALSSAEEGAFVKLAAARRQLVMDGGRVNTKSDVGYNACVRFLGYLDAMGLAFRLEAAPRSYRRTFTMHYRTLFVDESRNYLVDVFDASIELNAVIWFNGDKFEFSEEAKRRAETLQRAWAELLEILSRWSLLEILSRRRHATEQPWTGSWPSRGELLYTVAALDFAWASFEQKYVAELMDIEEKARHLIVQAIEHERNLQFLEAHHGSGQTLQGVPSYHEEQRRLAECIARLNSVANFRGKGRDDLSADVLADATTTLQRCGAADSGHTTENLSAARFLATGVIQSFTRMRAYFREVEGILSRVDPHLRNNAGLVSRLVDWEEAWEVGTRYLGHEMLLNAVCGLVTEIRSAQGFVPALSAMCEDRDVEFFLVIPRILWLRFFVNPSQNIELLRSVLPHRFEARAPLGEAPRHSGDHEVWALTQRFAELRRYLNETYPERVPDRDAGWEIIITRAVSGTSGQASDVPPGPWHQESERLVGDFILKLEIFSLELQRQCPNEWNRLANIVTQCLSGGPLRQGQMAFRV